MTASLLIRGLGELGRFDEAARRSGGHPVPPNGTRLHREHCSLGGHANYLLSGDGPRNARSADADAPARRGPRPDRRCPRLGDQPSARRAGHDRLREAPPPTTRSKHRSAPCHAETDTWLRRAPARSAPARPPPTDAATMIPQPPDGSPSRPHRTSGPARDYADTRGRRPRLRALSQARDLDDALALFPSSDGLARGATAGADIRHAQVAHCGQHAADEPGALATFQWSAEASGPRVRAAARGRGTG